MNQRVTKLRQQSLDIIPYISSERAELITDFYESDVPMQVSTPVCRAMAFKYIMQHKTVFIDEGELIVGNRGPAPKATSTYPELCCHNLEDFSIMSTRERTHYNVSDEVMKIYKERIIPFWSKKTMREKVFDSMTDEWKKAFNAGVFTEFMEQRAPGHAILDDKIYLKGMTDFKQQIADSRSKLDFINDKKAYDKDQQLQAMVIAADAIILFAHRYSEKASQLAENQTNQQRKVELLKISEICHNVPANAPKTFHEALQAYWFVHLGVITELNTWDSFNPGRLDLNLYPFYKRDLQNGCLTPDQARELLQCFWIKFNDHPAPPKVEITEEQSGTYTDFALINVGGLDPQTGADAVNELSYLILDVVEEMRLIQPSACIQLSAKNPDSFLKRACEVIRTGFGQPSVFNTDVIIKEMLYNDKSMTDARAGGPSGCVTISAFGKESCTLTGYYNWAKVFELACNSGKDPVSGWQLGPDTADVRQLTSFDEFMDIYKTQLKYFADLKIEGNNIIERLFANNIPAPFMSVLMDDCISKGLDYHNGGPRYNTTYIQGVGIGSVIDAMTAIKYHVFDKKTLTMEQLLCATATNFEGFEDLRQLLLNRTPRYGNDNDYADTITEVIFNAYMDVLDGRENTKGGKYRVNLLPTTVHIYFGSVCGALPNGRLAGEPLSDGISPHQGADTNGPTAVIKSAARIDHARTGGTLLNLKFNPRVLQGQGLDKFAYLIRSYFKMDGHHVQFNVITADTLRKAQQNPQQNRDLIVRVAGYSDCFIDLGKPLQDEIISRTEQQAF